jgi:alkanesulfonate monooxygenase SsuD/methylene tetrahydromethanopterin reductase-like flavin-dependent oxidoreductase (luciferase family)
MVGAYGRADAARRFSMSMLGTSGTSSDTPEGFAAANYGRTSTFEGSGERMAGRLRELAQAGGDQAILVVSPINERSICALGEVIAHVGG